MDNPDSYKKSSSLRGDDHAKLLNEFAPFFNWRADGKDSLIDIGCAGGNVTTEIVLPKLPPTFSRLMGVDINENMIDYATKNYKIPNVSFSKLDIGGDISEFMKNNKPFDHAVSFFCFHLVPDQKLAMQNIFKLLQPNGDFFLYTIADYTGFDVYKKMFPKWSEYMIDIDDYVSQYHQRIDPVGMLKKHLSNAGFKECNVTERRKTVVYHDVEQYIGAFEPVIPFLSRIPLSRRHECLLDYAKLSMEIKRDESVTVDESGNSENVNIHVSYKFLVAYARK